MSLRELAFSFLLALFAACIVVGVYQWSPPAGWVTAGICGIGWSWLVLTEAGEDTAE